MAREDSDGHGRRRTVLIADDEVRLARAMDAMLDDEELRTVLVHDGAAALERAQALRPDLIILDVMMPGRTGIEVCASLKTHPDTRNIPIILVTARAEKIDRMLGDAAGADGYLTKPFSPTELIELVNQALAGRPIDTSAQHTDPADMPPDQLIILAQELKALVEKERCQREALEQAQRRLDELDRLKAAFLEAVTHELLTPFIGVSLPMEILQQNKENLRPEQVSALDSLATGIASLHRRVSGVVKFAELVSKRREPQPGRIALHRVIPWAVQPVAVLAQARNVDFRVFVPEELPEVDLDPELLGEAVFQMAHNAVKFNHPGGSARVSAFTTDEWMVIEVSDDGAGLTEEQLAVLRQPFHQNIGGLQHGQAGLGIGWTLVCYVAEAHKGWARVKSDGPDQGSVFALALPLNEGLNTVGAI
ncbi:MAG: response regulator [Chloroflexi bacterium]|nr:response regulator [Chloroflexota bacterium]